MNQTFKKYLFIALGTAVMGVLLVFAFTIGAILLGISVFYWLFLKLPSTRPAPSQPPGTDANANDAESSHIIEAAYEVIEEKDETPKA